MEAYDRTDREEKVDTWGSVQETMILIRAEGLSITVLKLKGTIVDDVLDVVHPGSFGLNIFRGGMQRARD